MRILKNNEISNTNTHHTLYTKDFEYITPFNLQNNNYLFILVFVI